MTRSPEKTRLLCRREFVTRLGAGLCAGFAPCEALANARFLDACSNQVGIILDYGEVYTNSYAIDSLGHADHRGIDIGSRGSEGDLIIASAPGVVVWVNNHPQWGWQIFIRHYCTMRTRSGGLHHYNTVTNYDHVGKPVVRSGQAVRGGQVIARADYTGDKLYVPYEHTHWEVIFSTRITRLNAAHLVSGDIVYEDFPGRAPEIMGRNWHENMEVNLADPKSFLFDGAENIRSFQRDAHVWPHSQSARFPDTFAPLKLVWPVLRRSC